MIRLNNTGDWITENLRRSVQADDWQLYRLKCTPNTEYELVHRLLTQSDYHNELRAAFYNQDIIGIVFLEARFSREPTRNTPSLFDALAILSDVRISTLRIVPSDDYHASLNGNPSPTSFYSSGDWVTVGDGLYKGDAGLVIGHTETLGGRLGVLLAPRLALKSIDDIHEFEQKRKALKRKRGQCRPRPVLFTLDRCGTRLQDLVTRVRSDDALTKQDFKHKVLVLTVFQQSKHPWFISAPIPCPDIWLFLPGDKVVFKKSNVEFSGIVKDVELGGISGDSRDENIFPDEEGLVYLPFISLRKVIVPGDYIKVLSGPKKDTTGLVAAVTPRLVGIIPDHSQTRTLWFDSNTVGLTDSSRLVQGNFPWKNVQVRVMGGLYSNRTAVIKNVHPNGRGSLQLSIFIPSLHHSTEIDYTQVVEYSSGLILTKFQPIPDTLHSFIPNDDLEAMKTGQKPWIRARVKIIKGPWKGYAGVVYDVNTYKLNPAQIERRASGISLLVELSVVTPTETHPRHHIDYDFVREASTWQLLADAIKPTEHQSFFMPSSAYAPSKDTSIPRKTLRSGTPEPDSFAQSFVFTGVWHPQWEIEGARNQEHVGDPVFRPPLDYFNENEPANELNRVDFTSPELRQNIWIYHRNLVGIPICVGMKGRKGTQYVRVVPRPDGGFQMFQDRSTGGEPLLVWAPDVSRSNDRPKPKTEKSLMVVVNGPEEHIGKLVRRIHHFYKGSKSDSNLWFILGVVNFPSETEEILTSERIDAHPDQLEKVQETRTIRIARHDFRKRSFRSLRFNVRNDIKLRPTGCTILCSICAPNRVLNARSFRATSIHVRAMAKRFTTYQISQNGLYRSLLPQTSHSQPSKMSNSPDDSTEHSTVGRQSLLSQAQQDVVRAKFPKWEKILCDHDLHLGKLDREGAKARDPDKVTDWLDQTVQEVKSSPVFNDWPDTSKKLTKTIEAMFRNYRNNTFIKRNQHDIIQDAIAKLRKVLTNHEVDASKAAEALVCFKSPGGAKQIFRVENEEKIHEEMARMRAEAAQALT
ncbi:hypothetical protein EV361DRAFT_980827, partial [Lentinula raphanica]